MHFMSFILHFTKSKVVISEKFHFIEVDDPGSGRSWKWMVLTAESLKSGRSIKFLFIF